MPFAKEREEIKKKVSTAHTIAISGHKNPDGDCVGACLGLCAYLKEQYPDKQVDVYLEPIKESFTFLAHAEQIRQEKRIDGAYDLYFALDCSEPERLHHFLPYFEEAKYKICIDHHFTNKGFGDLCIVDAKAAAASEILAALLPYEAISLSCAQALYMGIVHDTGVFKHTNTTRRTMELAGALLDKGVHSEDIIDRTFFRKTYVQNQILGRALSQSILLLQGKVIFSVITRKDFAAYGIDTNDLDGVIDQLRVTEGIVCAILLYETEEGDYKVSMRANGNVDVSRIAQMFGGGGHVKAAGCNVHGEPRDIVSNIASMVEQQLGAENVQESIYDTWDS